MLESTSSESYQLRLRVFAGPNGSGKSTVIKSARDWDANGQKLDMGIYVNADDIAVALKSNSFTFSVYNSICSKEEILAFASTSGLLTSEFTYRQLEMSFQLEGDSVFLIETESYDRLSQIIARFLREKLLEAKERFSFETVFSHESNLDIMLRAAQQGYKVYLYFVSTASPEINKYRVALRVERNGHDVPADKIESRYYRSLSLAKRAFDISYQAFFFDNSVNDEPFKLVGHFKRIGEMQVWDEIDESDVTDWFYRYCV